MRVLVWLGGFGLFILSGVIGYLAPPQGFGPDSGDSVLGNLWRGNVAFAQEVTSSADSGSDASASSPALIEANRRIDEAFLTMKQFASGARTSLTRAVSGMSTRRFESALLSAEMLGELLGAKAKGVSERLSDALLATFPKHQAEWLFFLPNGGAPIVARSVEGHVGLVELEDETAERLAALWRGAPEGSDRKASVALLPGDLFGLTNDVPAFASSRIVWARPDAPAGVLIAAVSVESAAERLVALLSENAVPGKRKVQQHIVALSKGKAPEVVSGDEAGTKVLHRLVDELGEATESRRQAFLTQTDRAGRWLGFKDHEGRLAAAWGVSIPGVIAPAAVDNDGAPVAESGRGAASGRGAEDSTAEVGTPTIELPKTLKPADSDSGVFEPNTSPADVDVGVGDDATTKPSPSIDDLPPDLVDDGKQKPASDSPSAGASAETEGASNADGAKAGDESTTPKARSTEAEDSSELADLIAWARKALPEDNTQASLVLCGIGLGFLLLLWFVFRRRSDTDSFADLDAVYSSKDQLSEFEKRLASVTEESPPAANLPPRHLAPPPRPADLKAISAGTDQLEKSAQRNANLEEQNRLLEKKLAELTKSEKAERANSDERMSEAVQRLQEEWESKADALRGEVDEARVVGKELIGELEKTRNAEAELRTQLAQAGRWAEDLEGQYDEESTKRTALESELATLKAKLAEKDGLSSDADKRVAETEELLAEALSREEELEVERDLLAEQLQLVESSLSDSEAAAKKQAEVAAALAREAEQRATLEESAKELCEKIRVLEESQAKVDQQRVELEQELETAQAKVAQLEENAATQEAGDEARVQIEEELQSLREALAASDEARSSWDVEVARLNTESDLLRADLESKSSDIDELRGQLAAAEENLAAEQLLEQLEAKDQEIAAAQLRIAELEPSGQEAESLRSELEARTRELEESAQKAAELEQAGQESEALQLLVVSKERELEEKTQAHAELEQNVAELKQAIDESAQAGAERDELRSKLTSLEEASVLAEERIATLEAELADAASKTAELESLQAQMSELDDGLAAAVAEAEESAGELSAKSKELEAAAKDRVELESQHREEIEQMRSEIQAVQEFQSALIQGNLPAATLAVDPALKVFVWNPMMERLSGVSGSTALGCRLTDIPFACPELAAHLRELAESSAKSGKPVTPSEVHEFSVEKNGSASELHVRVFAEPISSDDGDSLGVLLSIEDVTEIAALERDCDFHELFHEGLVQSIPVAVVITDEDDQIVTWNQHAERILKVREKEALGQNLLKIDCRVTSDRFRADYAKAAKGGKPARFAATRGGTPDGTRYLVTFAPFLDTKGNVCGRLLLVERAAQPVGVNH